MLQFGVLYPTFSVKMHGNFEWKCATPQTYCCPSMAHHPVDCSFMALQNCSWLKADKIRGLQKVKMCILNTHNLQCKKRKSSACLFLQRTHVRYKMRNEMAADHYAGQAINH